MKKKPDQWLLQEICVGVKSTNKMLINILLMLSINLKGILDELLVGEMRFELTTFGFGGQALPPAYPT